MVVRGLKRLGSGSVAAFLSLALHALLIAPLVSGGHRHGAAAAPSAGSVLIDLGETSEPARDSAAFEPPPPPRMLDIAAGDLTDALELPRIETPSEEQSAVPPYVLYMGQVTARIQSRWAVPPARDAADFHCRAQIRRGPGGEVEDLTLQPCDEDPMLKASVLEAIRLAAPLPTRPEAAQPGEVLTLDFAVFAATAEGRRSSVQPGG